MGSIKFMNSKVADDLYNLAHSRNFNTFMEVLQGLQDISIDTRQVEILIKIDFFSEFGNQRELLRLMDIFYNLFKKGDVRQISRDKVDGTLMEPIIRKYSSDKTKAGVPAKKYTILDLSSILCEMEEAVMAANMDDLSDIIKIQNFKDYMGYAGYVSEKEEDRPKLFVLSLYPLRRKADGKQFGYSVITKSIGSGKESRFTVFNRVFDKDPIKENDVILCTGYDRDGQYFTLTKYSHIYA